MPLSLMQTRRVEKLGVNYVDDPHGASTSTTQCG